MEMKPLRGTGLKAAGYDERNRKLVIEMFWDGEDNPSVRAPLGDFFGVGHAVAKHYVSLPIACVFGPRRGPNGPFAAAMNTSAPGTFDAISTQPR